jgi:uncharacterized repeat protein (TIGR02059 family)
MKKKLLSILMTAAMLLSLLPMLPLSAAAIAPVTIPAGESGARNDCTISADGTYQLATEYTGLVTIGANAQTVTLVGSGDAAANNAAIFVAGSRTTGLTLTIQDLKIRGTDSLGIAAIDFRSATGAGVDCALRISGACSVTGDSCVGILIGDGVNLMIDKTTSDAADQLNISSNYLGIGSSVVPKGGSLSLNGGTINVDSLGPVIGGSNVTVTVNGGIVVALGTGDGAGIGGDKCTVTINGGDITASSKNGAGIGGDNTTVLINGGTVTASACLGAGIGGSRGSTSGNSVIITSGLINAVSNSQYERQANGAGIGDGFEGQGTNVTISGGTITATSVRGCLAGIGGGAGTVTISGGTIVATGTYNGAGIGGCSNEAVNISGGTLTATSLNYGGAGIGSCGGYTDITVKIQITGTPTIIATASEGGSNIGNGSGERNTSTLTDGAAPTPNNLTYLRFHVTDGTNNIEGATVRVGVYDYITNADGLTGCVAMQGAIPYSVTKDGYRVFAGTTANSEGVMNLDVPVTLEAKVNWTDYAADAYAGGDGLTAETAWQIATPEQLALLAKNAVNSDYSSGKYFILTDNINLNGYKWTPIPKFYGYFDGNGKTIDHLTVSISGNIASLFGEAYNATITDLGVINTSVAGNQCVAPLIGYSVGNAVNGCYATGIVNGIENVGGLVGWAQSTVIANCYSTCSVTGSSGWGNIGGILGCSDDGVTIHHCYTTGAVANNGGSSRTGGVVGGVNRDSSCVCTYSYYASTNLSGYRGLAAALADMKLPAFVDALNGSQSPAVWIADTGINDSYPILSWQAPVDPYWTGHAATGFADGDGSSGNPFQIATPEQLALLAKNAVDSDYSSGKYFILTEDIDLSGYSWKPIASFSGSLDGQCHVIRNLQINANTDYQGLIAKAGANVMLKNLTLDNCGITTTGSFAGALAGSYEASGTLTVANCHSSGSITSNNFAGGLFGDVQGTSMGASRTITACSSSCIVKASTTGVSEYGFAGGLIGRCQGSATSAAAGNLVTACFATGSVAGKGIVGGLVGWTTNAAYLNCYATGAVSDSGGVSASGLIGHVNATVSVANCYASGGVSTSATVGAGGVIGNRDYTTFTCANSYYTGLLAGVAGTPAASADMKLPAFVAALNASQSPAVWVADTGINSGFPILAWQIPVVAAPVLQSAATSVDGTKVILTFDKNMADPSLCATQFGVTVDGGANAVTAASLNTADHKIIELTLTSYTALGRTVAVSYMAGDVKSADGGVLASFANQPVSNNLPSALNVSISGTTDLGQTLSGSYTYNTGTAGYAENGTALQWLRSTGADHAYTTVNTEYVNQAVSGPPAPATFTLYTDSLITSISTYHWNGGTGPNTDVTLSLKNSSGVTYGPWQTVTVNGMDNKPVFREAAPNIIVPAGVYTVVDSEPSTWSFNDGSGSQGFATIKTSDFTKINNKTLSTYTVSDGDAGKSLVFKVTVQDTCGNVGIAAYSAPFGPIPDYVCAIGTTGYASLTGALTAVSTGQTITLLKDINYETDIVVGGKSITFDLNGYTLTVKPSDMAFGINVGGGGTLDITGSGAFNIDSYGILVHDGGKATVTNVIASSAYAVEARGSGSAVHIKGNIDAGTGVGAYASGGAAITVDGTINAGAYIQTGDITKNAADQVNPTTKDGYLTYTDGTSIVWVKNPLPSENFDILPVNGWTATNIDDCYTWEYAPPTGMSAHSAPNVAIFDSKPGVGWSHLRQNADWGFAIPAGQTYYLTFWVYHSGSYADNNSINVMVYNDRGNGSSKGVYSLNTGEGWTKHTIDLSEYSGNRNVRIDFNVISASGQKIYIDDIAVTAPAAAPVLQSAATTADGTKVLLTFDKDMADPALYASQFSVMAGGSSDTVTAAARNGSDSKQLELTLATAITNGQTVTVGYAAGNVTALDGGVLASFTDWPATNNVPVPTPVISSVSASPATITSAGGISGITVEGSNLTNGIRVTAFDGVNAPTVTGTTTGSGTSQTVTLTFPANAGSAEKTYTIKVSLDSGASWNAHTASVTVSKPASQVSTGGDTGVLGATDTVQVITTHSGGAVINTAGVGATGAPQSGAAITQEVIDALLDAAKETGGTGRRDTLAVDIDVPDGSTGCTATLPAAAFKQLAGQTDSRFSLSSFGVSVTFDGKAVDAISSAAKGDTVVFSATTVDKTKLTPAQQSLVGSRPVYDLAVTSGGQTISTFGGGYATVRIPYTLSPGENPLSIYVCCLTDKGTLEYVRGYYDTAAGTVVFVTSHFSQFVIRHREASFNDVPAGSWYENAVRFIASREISEGTGSGNFSPDSLLTRGEFIVMLLRAYGIAPETAPADNFSDAGNTYYTGYLAAAKHLGISSGVGDNHFAPGRTITRQEMLTLLYNALKAIGQLPEASGGKILADFTDSDRVASWSQDAMKSLVEAGIVAGTGGRLNPEGTTMRSEMAQVLYKLLSA